jgi:solute:Na+ symporter, SSS family
MSDQTSLHLVDWILIATFFLVVVGIGLYFSKRAGKNIDSFFLSSRTLPWYLAGFSMIATTFAADAPLLITSLVRQYGVHYIWQYWAPAIGASLAVVLFARLWRRMRVLTDIELIEFRYTGRAAAVLRFWLGFSTVLLFPLVLGWVTKAMEVITREAMGIPPEYQFWTTIGVVLIGLISCAFSGLWGVVWTDFFLFILGTTGTIILAIFSVNKVGGMDVMIEKLSTMQEWSGHNLNIAPIIGSGPTKMSLWNAIGYFGILWVGTAVAGSFMAQRLMACKNVVHSTYAMLTFTIVYYGLICWPWIIVALCSIILLPTLGGVTNDCAYPRMIVAILPIGLRGLLIAALMGAFISTISTFFNLGSSYLVNDVYKRFIVRKASNRHYVNIGRLTTVYLALAGGVVAFMAVDIQQILSIMFVTWAGTMFIVVFRWFWWRLNAMGELVATIVSWIIAPLLLFGHVFDGLMYQIFGMENFSTDPNYLGARMLFMVMVITPIAIVVSLLTKPTDIKHLEYFINRARPFHFFWKPVIKHMDGHYQEAENLGRTLVSWIILAVSIFSLIFGVGKLLFGHHLNGIICILIFIVTLWLTIRRCKEDFANTVEDSDSLDVVSSK